MANTKVAYGLTLLLLSASQPFAADSVTNLISSIISYQYPEDIRSADLALGGIQSPFVSFQYPEDLSSVSLWSGGILSSFVSFQYLENFGSAALMNGGTLSPFVSYQYYEWPGDDILKLVNSPPVSYLYEFNFGLNFASVTVSPTSVPADGASMANVTVTMWDSSTYSPLIGKDLRIQVIGTGDVTAAVATPAAITTDSSGRATAAITSSAPGTVLVVVTNVTDGVILADPAQQHLVTFTGSLATPEPDLTSAIQEAATSLVSLLAQGPSSAAVLAIDEGQIGDYFNRQITIEAAQACVDALFTAVGIGADETFIDDLPVWQQIVIAVGETVGNQSANDDLKTFIEKLTQGSRPLGKSSTALAGMIRQRVSQVDARAKALLGGVPPTANANASDWATNLRSRTEANQVLWREVKSQDEALNQLYANSIAGGDAELMEVAFGAAVSVVAIYSPPPVDLIIGLGAFDFSLLQHYEAQKEDILATQTAWSSLVTCSQIAKQIADNTSQAIAALAAGGSPESVTGTVLKVGDTGLWALQNPFDNPLANDLGTAGSTSPYVMNASRASTIVQVSNTGRRSAYFQASASYKPDTHDANSSQPNLVVTAAKEIAAGETADIELVYFDGKTGTVPDPKQPIHVDVVAFSDIGTFYIGSGDSVNFLFTPTPGILSNVRRPRSVGIGASVTNTWILQNPLRTSITRAPDPAGVGYQVLLQTWNPFPIPLRATVTQPIPDGVSVISTDGTVGNAGIVWNQLVQPNGYGLGRFIFQLLVIPGAITNLPMPTLVFARPSSTNNLNLLSLSRDFAGALPVQVMATVPPGVPGTNTAMTVWITNLMSSTEAGLLTVSLTNQATSFESDSTQSFSLPGSGGTNLTFVLPGNIPEGRYAVTALLAIDGGQGVVLNGAFTMPSVPIQLGIQPASAAATGSLSLVLEGRPGTGYVLQTSTDLVNWTPLEFLVLTNSPLLVPDLTRTNQADLFYRAAKP